MNILLKRKLQKVYESYDFIVERILNTCTNKYKKKFTGHQPISDKMINVQMVQYVFLSFNLFKVKKSKNMSLKHLDH